MGSVKDLEIVESPSKENTGRGIFHFSDRYSVFDWGEMPVAIDGKGKVLATMGAYTFEMLEENGIETHYVGMEEGGEAKKLEDLSEPSDTMHIELVNVVKPEFINGKYVYPEITGSDLHNYLIPLEVIFRNTIPIGSSARRRYSPEELGLPYDKWPEEAVELKDPIVESSTKLEEQDRYIEDEEAEGISGVDLDEIYKVADRVNEIITRRADQAGLRHDDGKIELLYIDGDVVVGDVAGTFDENRFSYEGLQVSKEVLRQGYKETQPGWVEEVKEAKERAKKEGIKDWKSIVEEDPRRLGIEDLVSEMYKAGANLYMGVNMFEARDLEEVMNEIRSNF
ncbi:MAG: phosphoribosylaminoimidazolesuccinocarboxamide synthase [Candidatus Hadarchaeota archaeon]